MRAERFNDPQPAIRDQTRPHYNNVMDVHFSTKVRTHLRSLQQVGGIASRAEGSGRILIAMHIPGKKYVTLDSLKCGQALVVCWTFFRLRLNFSQSKSLEDVLGEACFLDKELQIPAI